MTIAILFGLELYHTEHNIIYIIKMAETKKTDESIGEDGEQFKLPYISDENKKFSYSDNCLSVSYKVKNSHTTYSPEIPLLDIFLERNANICSHKGLCAIFS